MEANLVINGVDFARWAKEGGIVQSTITRQTRSVTTLDGTLYKTEVKKRGISLSLVEIRDATLSALMGAITDLSTVEYTDRDEGDRTSQFYVRVDSAAEKTVRGGNTYWNGVSIEMEEK